MLGHHHEINMQLVIHIRKTWFDDEISSKITTNISTGCLSLSVSNILRITKHGKKKIMQKHISVTDKYIGNYQQQKQKSNCENYIYVFKYQSRYFQKLRRFVLLYIIWIIYIC